MRFRSFLLTSLLFTLCIFANDSRRTASASFASTVAITASPQGAEGNVGTIPFNFTLTRSGDLIGQCRVVYETREGTAFSPEDFTYVTGTATFAPGQTTLQIPVTVIGETYAELDETFTLVLLSAAGDCTLSGGAGTAIIFDTDGNAPPGTCVNGIEGDIGIALDAAIRVDDLVRVRRLVLGIDSVVNGCQFQKADINGTCGDGRIDTADVTVLRQWILQGGGQRPNCGPQAAI